MEASTIKNLPLLEKQMRAKGPRVMALALSLFGSGPVFLMRICSGLNPISILPSRRRLSGLEQLFIHKFSAMPSLGLRYARRMHG